MSRRTKFGLGEEFLELLGATLSKRGFRRVPKRATFHRATSEGWVGIHVPITRYMDGAIKVALTAMIRFDVVEKIILRLTDNPLYVDGPNRGTFALYMTEGRGEFGVENVRRLSGAVTWARQKCAAHAEKFFETFPALEDAYLALMEQWPVNSHYDLPAGNERAKRALAAAVTLRGADHLDELAAALRAHLVKDPHAFVSEFDDFARRLADELRD